MSRYIIKTMYLEKPNFFIIWNGWSSGLSGWWPWASREKSAEGYIYPITVSLVKWLHHFSVRIERNWPKTDGIRQLIFSLCLVNQCDPIGQTSVGHWYISKFNSPFYCPSEFWNLNKRTCLHVRWLWTVVLYTAYQLGMSSFVVT